MNKDLPVIEQQGMYGASGDTETTENFSTLDRVLRLTLNLRLRGTQGTSHSTIRHKDSLPIWSIG